MAAAIGGWRRGCERARREVSRRSPTNSTPIVTESQLQRLFTESQLQRLLKRYDEDDSGALEHAELRKLLADRDPTMPKGTLPTEDEVQYVLWLADKSNDMCINKEELAVALNAWEEYIGQRRVLQATLDAFNTSGSGALQREELHKYLEYLNAGRPVSEDDNVCVFQAADLLCDGVLHVSELALAKLIWTHAIAPRRAKHHAKSAACAVM